VNGTPPHDHAWVVSPWLLTDELARRSWLQVVRREWAQTGRVRFCRHDPNAWGLLHNLPPLTVIEVRGCTTRHDTQQIGGARTHR
jgi:hypothetical protein